MNHDQGHIDDAHGAATPAAVDATVGEVLRRAARHQPELTAILEGAPLGQSARAWTFEQLAAESEQAARALLNIVDPGEKIALWANNAPECVLLQFGAALAGVTLVTMNPALQLEEAAHIIRDSGSAAVFHLDRYRGFDVTAGIDAIRPSLPSLRRNVPLTDVSAFTRCGSDSTGLPVVAPEDIAQIQYTSGTTGLPKGVALKHASVVHTSAHVMGNLGLNPGESFVHAMPLFHSAGSVLIVLGCVQARLRNVLMPHFDPGLQLALMETERSSVFAGVATMLRAMLHHPEFERTDLSSLRVAISGGAMVEPDLALEVEARLDKPLTIVYGQTESAAGVTMTVPSDSPDDRRATVGRTLPGVDVRIAEPADPSRDVAVGEVGEICVRGENIMAGYHDAPTKTAASIDQGGWLHTGDLGALDDRGYLQIRGRIIDMVIRGGENIYPVEIESHLVSHPDIVEAAVVGVPDPHWGERLVGFVRLVSGVRELESPETFLAERLARHKIPREWHVVESFPLTAAGKVLKSELRARLSR